MATYRFKFTYDVGGATRVRVEAMSSGGQWYSVAYGVALLHPNDQFEKAVGRRTALTRALRTWPRPKRGPVWTAYFQQHSDLRPRKGKPCSSSVPCTPTTLSQCGSTLNELSPSGPTCRAGSGSSGLAKTQHETTSSGPPNSSQPQSTQPRAVNAVKCLECKAVVRSLHRHDFRTCRCGAVSVDGGPDYQRILYNTDAAYQILTTEAEWRAALAADFMAQIGAQRG